MDPVVEKAIETFNELRKDKNRTRYVPNNFQNNSSDWSTVREGVTTAGAVITCIHNPWLIIPIGGAYMLGKNNVFSGIKISALAIACLLLILYLGISIPGHILATILLLFGS